jgi:hypothetical protein
MLIGDRCKRDRGYRSTCVGNANSSASPTPEIEWLWHYLSDFSDCWGGRMGYVEFRIVELSDGKHRFSKPKR